MRPDTGPVTVTGEGTAHLIPDRWWPVQVPGIGLLREGLVPVRVTLAWATEAPYEVVFRFRSGTGWVPWAVSRELVALGLLEPVEELIEPFEDQRGGQGDVRFEPPIGGLLMVLDSPDGHARVLLDLDVIAGFLRETYRHIPLGAEQVHVPDVEFFTSTAGGGLR